MMKEQNTAVREYPDPYNYDIFISYSRQDIQFARALEKAIENYSPPKGLGLNSGNLRVFRDESDLTGSEYYNSIDSYLSKSKKLVVICSPAAFKSKYVNDEIRRWKNGHDNIIPILVAGIPNNEVQQDDRGEMSFPPALMEVIGAPLAIDYRRIKLSKEKVYKPPFENAWYVLLANIYNLSREDIEQRDRVREQQKRRIISAITLSIFLILSVLLVIAITQRNEAVAQRDKAIARHLASEANNMLNRPGTLTQSLLLTIESMQRYPTAEADKALREGLSYLPTKVMSIPTYKKIKKIAIGNKMEYVAAVLDKQELKLWDEKGSELPLFLDDGNLQSETLYIRQIFFSTDNKYFYVTYSHYISIIDMMLGIEISRIDKADTDAAIVDSSISKDDKYLAIQLGNEIMLWSLDERREVGRLRNLDSIEDFEFGNDPQLIAIAPSRGHPQVWDWKKNQELLLNHVVEEESIPWVNARNNKIMFSDGDKYLAVDVTGAGVNGSEIRLIELQSGITRMTLNDKQKVSAMQFSPKSRFLHIIGEHKIIRTYQAESRVRGKAAWIAGKTLPALVPHSTAFSSGFYLDATKFSRDASALAIGDEETIEVWQTADPARSEQLTVVHDDLVTDISFGHHNQLIASASSDYSARVWDIYSGDEMFRANHDGPVGAVALSPDAEYLATVSMPAYTTSPDKKTRTLTGSDKTARLWKLDSKEEISRIQLQIEPALATFSADAKTLAVSDKQGNVSIWLMSENRLLTKIENESKVLDIALSPRGKQISVLLKHKSFSGLGSSMPVVFYSINVIDIEQQRIVHELDAMSGDDMYSLFSPINYVRYSSDGKHIIASGNDQKTRIWVAESGKEVQVIIHQAPDRFKHSPIGRIMSEMFAVSNDNAEYRSILSPNHKTIATANDKGVVSIWDIEQQRVVTRLPRHRVQTLAYSPSGQYLATAGFKLSEGGGNSVRVWSVNTQDMINTICARLPQNLSQYEWQLHFPDEHHKATCPNLPLVSQTLKEHLLR